MVRATRVLPQPGCPYNNKPRTGEMPNSANNAGGAANGTQIRLLTSCRTSSKPPIPIVSPSKDDAPACATNSDDLVWANKALSSSSSSSWSLLLLLLLSEPLVFVVVDCVVVSTLLFFFMVSCNAFLSLVKAVKPDGSNPFVLSLLLLGSFPSPPCFGMAFGRVLPTRLPTFSTLVRKDSQSLRA